MPLPRLLLPLHAFGLTSQGRLAGLRSCDYAVVKSASFVERVVNFNSLDTHPSRSHEPSKVHEALGFRLITHGMSLIDGRL